MPSNTDKIKDYIDGKDVTFTKGDAVKTLIAAAGGSALAGISVKISRSK